MRTVRFWTAVCEIASFFLLVCLLVFFALSHQEVAFQISEGAQKEKSVLGVQTSLCLIFALGILVYGLLFLLKRFPRFMSYPVPITPENMDFQARLAKLMLSVLTLCSMGIFVTILYDTYKNAGREQEIGHIGIILGLLAGAILDVALYLAMARAKEKCI